MKKDEEIEFSYSRLYKSPGVCVGFDNVVYAEQQGYVKNKVLLNIITITPLKNTPNF